MEVVSNYDESKQRVVKSDETAYNNFVQYKTAINAINDLIDQDKMIHNISDAKMRFDKLVRANFFDDSFTIHYKTIYEKNLSDMENILNSEDYKPENIIKYYSCYGKTLEIEEKLRGG